MRWREWLAEKADTAWWWEPMVGTVGAAILVGGVMWFVLAISAGLTPEPEPVSLRMASAGEAVDGPCAPDDEFCEGGSGAAGIDPYSPPNGFIVEVPAEPAPCRERDEVEFEFADNVTISPDLTVELLLGCWKICAGADGLRLEPQEGE